MQRNIALHRNVCDMALEMHPCAALAASSAKVAHVPIVYGCFRDHDRVGTAASTGSGV